MMFCLMYIGAVVMLHIFTKVNKAAAGTGGSNTPNPEMWWTNKYSWQSENIQQAL